MQGYREIRTITGQKIFTRESKEEARDRRILTAEIVLTPLVVIWVFAKIAGMI